MGQLGLNSSASLSSSMKFLVFAACVSLSTCSLVTHHNGAVVPADTWEVASAKQAFHAAGGVIHPVVYSAFVPGPMVTLANGAVVHSVLPYPYMVTHPNGAVVPVEPTDVVAARA